MRTILLEIPPLLLFIMPVPHFEEYHSFAPKLLMLNTNVVLLHQKSRIMSLQRMLLIWGVVREGRFPPSNLNFLRSGSLQSIVLHVWTMKDWYLITHNSPNMTKFTPNTVENTILPEGFSSLYLWARYI